MKRFYYGILVIALGAFLMIPAMQGCKEAAKQCGLTCPDKGIADGNASITGVASIDGFFAAVINFQDKANLVASGINTELAAIAASVGMTGGADADFEGGFQAAVKAKFGLTSDLKVAFQPPQCNVSAKATIEATAKCDASVTPGKVSAQCSGKCEVDPGKVDLQASCSGDATADVTCTVQAPSVECSGTCTGSCQLDVAASCEGKCEGSCSGSTDSGGHCNGDCQGKCDLEAGGGCSGKCTGSCQYDNGNAKCEANAKMEVECKASGSATPPSVKCDGNCSAEVTPPKASADCQAKAKADAEVNASCTPPSVDVQYELQATGDATADAQAKAEFEAWLVGFKGHISAIAAAMAQAKIVVNAGESIGGAATTAIKGAANALDLEGDLVAKYRVASCMPDELKDVPGVIEGAGSKLSASVTASGKLMASLGQ